MSSIAQLKPFSIGPRALFVKCSPAPTTFFERRAVLAALQQATHDQIETFKKLNDQSSFMIITTNPEAAKKLRQMTPLERAVTRQDTSESETSVLPSWLADFQEIGPIATPAESVPMTEKLRKQSSASDQLGLSTRSFTLSIFPVNKTYSHIQEVKKNPLHGRWPGVSHETYMASALGKKVPSDVMFRGLRDWETGNQLSHDVDGFFTEGDPDGASARLLDMIPATSDRRKRAMDRAHDKADAANVPAVMRSVIKFIEDSRRSAASIENPPEETMQKILDFNENDGHEVMYRKYTTNTLRTKPKAFKK
ncbi:hypothetical protein F5Y16DRAFT_123606 [Xylariaceae sp. FL0255]|nr:hypothetical protein F5Y16DRAFT_123606 [Xylariaceae sp. FL0255]